MDYLFNPALKRYIKMNEKSKGAPDYPMRPKKVKKNSKTANKIHLIEFPMIGRELIFVNGCTDEEICDYISNLIEDEEVTEAFKNALSSAPDAKAVHMYNPDFCLGVILIRPTDQDSLLASLVHESLHFTFKVANHMGLVYSSDSEEFYTYFQAHVFRECSKFI